MSLVVGIDPAKRNMGWALLCAETGLPVAAGSASLDVRDGGWLETQVARAWDTVSARARVLRRDVVALAMEDPMAVSMSNAKAYGAVMALCQAEFHGRFGADMPHRVYMPKQWRVAAGLPGNASKGLVALEARALAIEAIREPHLELRGRWRYDPERMAQFDADQDRMDALMIARAYWLETNEGNDA